MRVAFLTPFPASPEMVPGGVAAVASNLVEGLGPAPGVDLHVISCSPEFPEPRTEERHGAAVHCLPAHARWAQLRGYRAERRAIARVLQRIRPDLVHANGLGWPVVAAAESGRPTATSLHGLTWIELRMQRLRGLRGVRTRWRARREYAQVRDIRHLFINTDYVRGHLPEAPGRTVHFVRNPVSEAVFGIRNAPDRPTVLVVGGTRPRKDPLTALRTFRRVCRLVPEARLVLLGPPSHGPLDAAVADYVRRHGMENRVSLPGLVPTERLHAEWARASLLLLTSLEETAPIAIGEACAVGVPTVGTDAAGIPFMVDPDETGFVCPVGDPDSLAECVARLLTEEPLRARMAAAARRKGETEFRLASIRDQMIAAWESVLAA